MEKNIRPKPKQNERIQIIDLVENEETSSEEESQKEKDIKFISRKQIPPPPQIYLTLCKLCFKQKVSQLLFPCHHACVCDDCFHELSIPKSCPICHGIVNRNIQFILCT